MLRHHISGFTIPIQVLDKKHAVQNTIATAALWTDLPAESSYPSSDELISLLQAHQGQMTIDELPEVLSRLAQHTLSENLGLVLDFPYFIDIQTDSGERRFAQHVSFSVRRDQAAQVDFILNTSFPVALNREAISLSISLKSSAFYWIEEIIALGDDAASQLISAETPLRDFVNHLTTSLQNLPSLEWVKVRITHNETPYYSNQISWSWPEEESEALIVPESREAPPFGAWLRSQRRARGLNQQRLAALLECSSSFLSRVEAGDKPPSLSLLDRLAELWELDLNRLYLRARIIPDPIAERIATNIDGFLHWVTQH